MCFACRVTYRRTSVYPFLLRLFNGITERTERDIATTTIGALNKRRRRRRRERCRMLFLDPVDVLEKPTVAVQTTRESQSNLLPVLRTHPETVPSV